MATRNHPQKKTASRAHKGTTIILVRHGQTPTTGKILPGRARGLNLSEVGRQQAERAAERLAELDRVAAIYTSPLERAKQTAAPIAAALGRRPQVERGLLECDFGTWTGKQLSTLAKRPEWATVQRSPSNFRFPDGESFTEMQQRMVTTLQRLRQSHRGETIICVSHADPIKAVVAHAVGTHLDLFQRIVISTCSLTAIAWFDSGPISLMTNSVSGPLSELVIS
jgi:probable phosphomutase (TIGR03848 family)